MRRRDFIQSVAVAPMATLPQKNNNKKQSSPNGELITDFFSGLEDFTPEKREEAITSCAEKLCIKDKSLLMKTHDITNNANIINTQRRRIKHILEIINKYGIANKISSNMVADMGENIKQIGRLTPLVGSANNLTKSACELDSKTSSDNIQGFIEATIAFGIEVILWNSTAPYQMAWKGTRFIANKSFIRYAKHGCSSCVSAIMSEIHWMLRKLPQTTISISMSQEDFITQKLRKVRSHANTNVSNYNIQLNSPKTNNKSSNLTQPLGASGVGNTTNNIGNIPLLIGLAIGSLLLRCYL